MNINRRMTGGSQEEGQFSLFEAVAAVDSSEGRAFEGGISDVARPEQGPNSAKGEGGIGLGRPVGVVLDVNQQVQVEDCINTFCINGWLPIFFLAEADLGYLKCLKKLLQNYLSFTPLNS